MQRFEGTRGTVRPLTIQRSVQNPDVQVQKSDTASKRILSPKQLQQIRKLADEKLSQSQSSNLQIIKYNQDINRAQKQMLIDLEVKATAKQIMMERIAQRFNAILESQASKPKTLPPEYYKKQAEIHQQIQRKILKIQIACRKNFEEAEQTIEQQKIKELLEEEHRRIDSEIERKDESIAMKEKDIEAMARREQYLNSISRILFEDKKRHNNALQESKGNIRVYCRLRPCKSMDKIEYEITENLLKVRKVEKDVMQKMKITEQNFLFEKVFAENASQSEVFDELSELVQCSIDGKNVCIFAYGQTGSGKTYTMNGNLEGDEKQRGFIPRSMEYIFKQVEIAKEKGYKSKISISVSEIYNNQHIDLLRKEEIKSKNSHFQSKKIMGVQKKVDKQLQFAEVTNFKEGLMLLQSAIKFRATGNTQMNIESSRSHLIFEIKNESENKDKNITRTSSLVLIDLAGSERNSQTGATGDRMEESKSINLSLTELRKVLKNLREGGVQTFRGSKLTSVLQNHLKGESKAVMFVNVGTEKQNLGQSIQSLGFAESVRECQTNQLKESKK